MKNAEITIKSSKIAKSSQSPQVSVIMPAFNSRAYIAKAIESVQEQTWQGIWELLIIDDASTDDTEKVVCPYLKDTRIHYLRQKQNAGVAAARNQGIAQAKGEYVAFLDSDDWWAPQKLELEMERLARTGAALCCTGRELVDASGESTGRCISVPEQITYRMLLHTNLIPCGSVVLRTELARKFQFVHDEYHEDYILWLKVLRTYGPAEGINQPLLKCRQSQGGKSRNKLKSARMQYGSYRFLGYGRLRSFYYMVFYTMHGILKYHL